MKNWNYRVCRDGREENGLLSIREVYYGEAGGVEAITLEPIAPKSETVEDLRWVLKKMLKACKEEVLVTHSLNEATDMRLKNHANRK